MFFILESVKEMYEEWTLRFVQDIHDISFPHDCFAFLFLQNKGLFTDFNGVFVGGIFFHPRLPRPGNQYVIRVGVSLGITYS